jgi:hypothetical protein
MNELVWLGQAKRALEKVATIGEAKAIADRVAAIKVFAAKQKWTEEQRCYLAEVDIRAGIRLGELLAKMPKVNGNRGNGRPKLGGRSEQPPKNGALLADMGITKDQSSLTQRAASVPARDRERFIAANLEKLVAHGYLLFTGRRNPLPVRKKKVTWITDRAQTT